MSQAKPNLGLSSECSPELSRFFLPQVSERHITSRHKEVTIHLSSFSVLVGAIGSGRSDFIQKHSAALSVNCDQASSEIMMDRVRIQASRDERRPPIEHWTSQSEEKLTWLRASSKANGKLASCKVSHISCTSLAPSP
jgi:hypothetical protein